MPETYVIDTVEKLTTELKSLVARVSRSISDEQVVATIDSVLKGES